MTLYGSAKFPHPDATILAPANRTDFATVTVVPKAGADLHAIVKAFTDRWLYAKVVHGGVKVTGPIPHLEETFGVKLFDAVFPDGTHFRSRVGHGQPVSVIDLPEGLDEHVVAVLGLDTRPFAHTYHHASPEGQGSPHTPAQVAALYGYPNATGAGLYIAIGSMGGGYYDSDLTRIGVDPSHVQFVSVDGGSNSPTGNPQSADGENILDLTVSLEGTGLSAKFMGGPNTDQAFYDITAAALADPSVVALSWSWGAPSSGWSGQAKAAWRQLIASAGKPVFVASGDGGLDDGGNSPVVDWPASCPGVIAVGGTLLALDGSEQVWNDSPGGASGGGFSTEDPRPSFQPGNASGRGVPDIALEGDPGSGYVLVLGGKPVGQWGGTSAAAPMAARGYALLYSVLGHHVMPFQEVLYANAGTFNRITGAGIPGEYGVPGQAPGAGLGSFNLTKLLAAFQTPPPSSETINVTFTTDRPTPVNVGDTVNITAAASGAPAANPLSYAWKDSSGTPYASTTDSLLMKFPNPGSFTTVCTVTDSATGVSGSASIVIEVNAPASTEPGHDLALKILDDDIALVQSGNYLANGLAWLRWARATLDVEMAGHVVHSNLPEMPARPGFWTRLRDAFR